VEHVRQVVRAGEAERRVVPEGHVDMLDRLAQHAGKLRGHLRTAQVLAGDAHPLADRRLALAEQAQSQGPMSAAAMPGSFFSPIARAGSS
jgi:hypothetical protein